MRKFLFLTSAMFLLGFNNAYEQTSMQVLNQQVISELTLIRNTYEWVNDKKVRRDMIKRQNRVVSNHKDSILYQDYLIRRN